MEFQTTAVWDEALWQEAQPIYNQAFPENGRKSLPIIRKMFERELCQLHTVREGKETVAMALTGMNARAAALIIDYLAVREEQRKRGFGKLLVEYIKTWSQAASVCRGIIIEVEADSTQENLSRIRFWEQCGFRLTEGVHQYIWVPEPYRAMVAHLTVDNRLPEDSRVLFDYITEFHKMAYRPK